MPITFEDSTVVTAQARTGDWVDIRMIRSDGGRPWPNTLWMATWPWVFVVTPIYLIYRAICRGWYVLTRSKRWAVVVLPLPSEDRNRFKQPRELLRYEAPNRHAAAERAEALRREIGRGEHRLSC